MAIQQVGTFVHVTVTGQHQVHPGPLQDHIDPGRVIAALREQMEGRVDQVLAPSGNGHRITPARKLYCFPI